jgi:uncharacterized membrane protein
MSLYYGFQSLVLTVLGAAALGCELFAFIDALRHPEGAYVAASKRTRTFWLIVTGVALLLGVVTLFNVISIIGIVAFVAAAVYLVDVRPALRQVRGLGSGSSRPW